MFLISRLIFSNLYNISLWEEHFPSAHLKIMAHNRKMAQEKTSWVFHRTCAYIIMYTHNIDIRIYLQYCLCNRCHWGMGSPPPSPLPEETVPLPEWCSLSSPPKTANSPQDLCAQTYASSYSPAEKGYNLIERYVYPVMTIYHSIYITLLFICAQIKKWVWGRGLNTCTQCTNPFEQCFKLDPLLCIHLLIGNILKGLTQRVLSTGHVWVRGVSNLHCRAWGYTLAVS